MADREALHGPDAIADEMGGIGDATVSMLGSDANASHCSATAIGRRHVVTAAHCAGDFGERNIAELGGHLSPAISGCAYHPGDVLPAPPDCGSLTPSMMYRPQHDIAVYTLRDPLGVPQRSLGPPRSCFRSAAQAVVDRGFAEGATRFRMAAVASRLTTDDGSFTLRALTSGLDAGMPDASTSGLDFFDPGDSGGPVTEAWRELAGPWGAAGGPIVALNSHGLVGGGLGNIPAPTEDATFLWSGRFHGMLNVDWIWSVIRDGGVGCVLGRVRAPALEPMPWPRERACSVDGEVRSDRDGDGIPDDRDLCPTVDGRNIQVAHMTTACSAFLTVLCSPSCTSGLRCVSWADDTFGCALPCGDDADCPSGSCARLDNGSHACAPDAAHGTACTLWSNHIDTDNDWVGDDCDPYPGTCNYDADDDHDGIPGAADNCPTFNPDQARCGGRTSGPGDACIPDADHDGRPDLPACDNCIGSFNPDQHDCNLDAEIEARSAVLGDVCDPHPCGDTVLMTRDIDHVLPFDPRAQFRVQDQIWIETMSTATQHARSAVRFCPCADAVDDSVPSRTACANQSLRACDRLYTEYAVAESAPDSRWRRTSLAYASCSTSGTRLCESGAPEALVNGPALEDTEAVASYTPVHASCASDADCNRGGVCRPDPASPSTRTCTVAPFRQDLVATWRIAEDQARWLSIYHDVGATDPRPLPYCPPIGPGSCTPPSTCIEGVCVISTRCSLDSDCGLDLQCRSGSCVPIRSCSSDVDCFETTICSGGRCVDDACTTSTDCDRAHVCNRGQCQSVVCSAAPSCASGLTDCGGTCVDTSSDANNCNACGRVCTAGSNCFGGSCAVCAPGLTRCGATCVLLSDDPESCGACGRACPSGSVCAGGVCAGACNDPEAGRAGLATCGRACADLENDPLRCGGCTTACAASAECVGATCAPRCASGLTSCGTTCADLQSDPRHCGTCTRGCNEGAACAGGACIGGCAQGVVCSSGLCSAVPEPRAGVLWTHTPGSADVHDFFADEPLTSHYSSGPIAEPRFLVVPPLPCVGTIAPFLGAGICAECSASFPATFISYGGVLARGACARPSSPFDVLLNIAGSLVSAVDVFPHLPMGDPAFHWVPAAEQDEWLTASSIRYAGLDASGTVMHTLTLGTGGFAEHLPCGPSGCAAFDACKLGCVALVIDPPPSLGVPVLSATRSTLYAVGVTDGSVSPAVTALPLSDVEGSVVPLGGATLGSVLAATYSPSRRALYVIDDVAPTPRGRASRSTTRAVRLSAISVDGTGPDPLGLTELARWSQDGDLGDYAIAEDPGGALYIAASHGQAGGHVVVQVNPFVTPARAVAVVRGDGPLVSTYMRASQIGLSLAAGHASSAHTIGYRPADFRRSDHLVIGDAFRP